MQRDDFEYFVENKDTILNTTLDNNLTWYQVLKATYG
jgi:hypothetical protein